MFLSFKNLYVALSKLLGTFVVICMMLWSLDDHSLFQDCGFLRGSHCCMYGWYSSNREQSTRSWLKIISWFYYLGIEVLTFPDVLTQRKFSKDILLNFQDYLPSIQRLCPLSASLQLSLTDGWCRKIVIGFGNLVEVVQVSLFINLSDSIHVGSNSK